MFDVFLSYGSSDHAVVEALAKALRDRDLSPFLDRWHLAGGQPWQDVLSSRLKESRAVAVLIGPGPLGPWQKREKEFALDRQTREAGFPVIPVLLPGADDPALDFLRLNTWIDLRAGLSDDRSIEALAAAIRGQPVGPAEPIDPRAEICPYRGLQPFREEDAAFFFGRETFTEKLLGKIATKRFLAVVGASGSGKSSVVRAGLVPKLRAGADGQSWEILTIVPGAEPLQALVQALDPPSSGLGRIDAIQQIKARANALRGDVTLAELTEAALADQPGTDRLLLVIDQFEELYTLVPPDRAADRERFLDLILGGTSGEGRLNIVLTLRGDFFAQALGRRDLADRLQDAVVNIGPLTTNGEPISELEAVIRRPAEAVGLTFEDGLVERILRGVGTEPGNLPLLEFLLTELWRQRRAGQLTNDAYTALGGVEGAIAKRADDALAQLDANERRAAKRLMLMLVHPGEGQEDTRVRASIPNDPDIDALVQRFASGDTRLLVTSEDPLAGRTVEVSHEALIRNWAVLRDWVDQNRGRLRARARVRDRMERWRRAGQPDDLLLPAGLDLEEGRALLANAGDLPIADLRAFIQASITAENARIAAAEATREAERQRELAAQRKVRNLALSAAAVVTVVAIVAGWQWWEAGRQANIAKEERAAAVIAKQDAEKARDEAEDARADADGARDFAEQQADRAAKLQNQAKAEASSALHQLRTAQIAQARFRAGKAMDLVRAGDAAAAVALARLAMPQAHPDGWPEIHLIPEVTRALTAALSTLKERAVLRGHEEDVVSAAFSPDGARIVTASADKTARIWDATTSAEGAVLRGHEEYVVSAAFSPGGAQIVTASADKTARIWDATTGAEIIVLRGHEQVVFSAAFSPDGARIVTASADKTARIWDAASGREIAALRGHDEEVFSATFSPDGLRIVTTSEDKTARIWDAKTGAARAVMRGHEQAVFRAAFTPDSARIVTASADKTARIWDATTGAERAVMRGHEEYVISAVFFARWRAHRHSVLGQHGADLGQRLRTRDRRTAWA